VRRNDGIKHQNVVRRHRDRGCGHKITLDYDYNERNLRKRFPQTVIVDQHDKTEENHWKNEVDGISEALPYAHDAERHDWRGEWI
jgi:hypothetical protein